MTFSSGWVFSGAGALPPPRVAASLVAIDNDAKVWNGNAD